MEDDERRIVFEKDDQTYIFIYSLGDECGLLDAIVAQIKNKQTNFCWEDAFESFYLIIKCFYEEVDILLDLPRDNSLS